MDEQESLDAARLEGRAEGIEEGELKAKKNIARNLLAAGTPLETICAATGLTAEEIARL